MHILFILRHIFDDFLLYLDFKKQLFVLKHTLIRHVPTSVLNSYAFGC